MIIFVIQVTNKLLQIMSKSFMRFLTFSMCLTLILSVFSCKDAPTYKAEITVIDFVSKKVVSGAMVESTILDPIPTKTLHEDIEQSDFTGNDGKVTFTFKHKANVHFKIEVPGSIPLKSGKTNIKLKEDETISKQVYVYLP